MKKHSTRTTDVLDRRNAFAGAGRRGGPSLLALWEMPELSPDRLVCAVRSLSKP